MISNLLLLFHQIPAECASLVIFAARGLFQNQLLFEELAVSDELQQQSKTRCCARCQCLQTSCAGAAGRTSCGCAQDSCTPNVVTYNTLVDVYGKMGNWERAIGVLDHMKGQARACP